MIITKLMGGLGNQMFQYAAARSLANIHYVPFKLDLSFFSTQNAILPPVTLRSYQIGEFRIQDHIASPEEVNRLTCYLGGRIRGRLFRLFQHVLPLSKRNIYRQRFSGYDPAFMKLGNNVYLDGYWQSWKFFVETQDIIREEFTLKSPMTIYRNTLFNEIKSKDSIGIHVRRGDYSNNPVANRYHGLYGKDYFLSAVSLIVDKIKNPHFFIFSDEPEWAEVNLKLDYPYTIVKREHRHHDAEDLVLLSLCQNFVISNSSFGWWAAWLSDNPNKMVITPKRWFIKERINMGDLLYKGCQSI